MLSNSVLMHRVLESESHISWSAYVCVMLVKGL